MLDISNTNSSESCSKSRGQWVHKAIEEYLKAKKRHENNYFLDDWDLYKVFLSTKISNQNFDLNTCYEERIIYWNSIRSFLSKIYNIQHIELEIVTKFGSTIENGRIDAIATLQGKNYIIEFTTTKYTRSGYLDLEHQQFEDKRIQIARYSLGFFQQYNSYLPGLLVIINPEEYICQTIESDFLKNYIRLAAQKVA